MKHLLRRAGFYLLAAAVAVVLNFLIPRMMPGDPATVMFARLQGDLDPEAIDAMREAFGLQDAPLHEQFWSYLSALAHGDLGTSVAFFPAPVSEVLGSGLMWTGFLAGGAMILAFTLGTSLGALSAWKQGGPLDSIAPPALALLGAFPYFWLAMLAAWVFGFQLEWFPLRGAFGSHLDPGFSWPFIRSVISHAFLPALTLVVVSLGGWLLTMRNTMVGVLGQEFIRYAQARGVPERRILVHYAARNALLPSVASFGMALGFVLSGALLTEVVFNYPGTGQLLLTAVRSQDYALLQGLFLTITFAVLIANWLVDLATVLLDPRTRQ
ncbi:MAG: ABC transporter permease [Myxococcota bacterium]|nr:ABC transporter permease [Myxococcota bacterium]